MESLTNWAGNYTFGAARLHRPETLAQLHYVVRHCHKARVIGARHSFNGIADSLEDLISLENMPHTAMLDRERGTVTVDAATRYGTLARYLHGQGYALRNLASLPHISVAGACATATHGSGDGNGNLATAVAGMELVTANGEVRAVSRERDGDQFDGMVVALGSLGVVTTLTLDVVPTFEVCQYVYENLPFAALLANFDEVEANAYSVSLFTQWQDDMISQIWLKRLVSTEIGEYPVPELFGATLATAPRHPLATMPADNCTEQMGVPGPWHERLTHFRMDFTPSAGEELQSEYFVPRPHAREAFRAINHLRERLAPVLHISEVRTIAPDSLWLSPCYGRACVAFHFTWKKDWDGVRKVLPLIEAEIAPFDARPHWGKLFTMSPAHLQSLYPKLSDFQQMLTRFDPSGKFRNEFMDTYILG